MGAAAALSLIDVDRLTGGRFGKRDVACPLCGPERRSPANRRRPVLRVWRLEEGFATFACARCGETGWTRDDNAAAPDPAKLAKARADAAAHQRSTEAERVRIAGWLWARRQPITERTPAGIYLRKRAYAGPIPETLNFLPASDDYPPAMIAAFGLAHESEPGKIAAPINVRGVHLTKVTPDGDKIPDLNGAKAKIMIGPSIGLPIVIAPPNDLLGLDGFKMPEGLTGEFVFNEADPAIADLKRYAHAKGWSQSDLSDVLSFYASSEAQKKVAFRTAQAREVAKLGANGTARVTAIDVWLRSMVGDELTGKMRPMIVSSSIVEGFERLASRFTTQGHAPFSQQHRTPEPSPGPGRVTEEQYNAMSQAERYAYARGFDQSTFKNSNGGPER